jgi:DNA-binding response OmpR family regulator
LIVTSQLQEPEAWSKTKVLVIDDDRDITELVYAILADEGFAVSVLNSVDGGAIRVAINQLEPDCILLDGNSPSEYGFSWDHAAWVRDRDRRVPLIMFSGHVADTKEAKSGDSPRSQAAGFASVLSKPFDIDQLLHQVATAAGKSAPFDRSEEAEHGRTAALVTRLQAAGARDVHASTHREWANFRTADGAFLQLYFWQRDGVYYLVRYSETGGRLETLGRFFDLEAAISFAMTERR